MEKLSEADRQKILQWNDTNCDYEKDVCVYEKLENTALQFPDKKAISYQNNHLTYKELNEAANALAHILISYGVGIEDYVIVYLERSLELMTAIFGTLKAGGVYVPVSAEFPQGRIDNIIEDTSPKVIISTKELSGNLKSTVPVFEVDDFLSGYSKLNINKPDVNVKPDNLAYAIFTSGTTGKPKGVLIEHHSVMNRIGWMQRKYPLNSEDVLIQKTTITFDVSIWELFWASFVGARLVLLQNGDEKKPEKILDTIKQESVSVIHFVPSMFNTFIKYVQSIYPENKSASLKWIFCSGEELLEQMVSAFYKLNNSLDNETVIVNLYGPTEATVDVTWYTCPNKKNEKIPIGRPIDNTQIFVVDENHFLLPPGEQGELIICGVNLARGYLNRDELTSQKFVLVNVFGKQLRAYKTGDIVYFDSDGQLIYVGRKDTQIKLRGFRIELGEIENTILRFGDVKECACVVKDKNTDSAHLVAFYITTGGNDINTSHLKEFLRDNIPVYMVPNVYRKIKEMPLSSSGKLDRSKLIDTLQNEISEEYTQGEDDNSLDKKMIRIWSKLLNKPKIGLTTNFFDLGGNSILVIQLSLLIKKELGIDIDVITLLQYPTVKSLLEHLAEIKK